MNAIIINGWASSSEIWNEFIVQMNFHKAVVVSNDILCKNHEVRQNAVESINNEIKNMTGDYIIIGWSMGSLVAIDVIEDMVRKPSGVVIMSGEMSHNPDEVNLLIENLKLSAEKYLDAFFMQAMTRAEKMAYFKSEIDKDKSGFKGGFQVDKLIIGLEYLRDTDLRNKLKFVNVPILWLHGREDAICSFTSGELSAKFIDNCRFVALEGVGHVPFRTAKEVCLEEVRNFIIKDHVGKKND